MVSSALRQARAEIDQKYATKKLQELSTDDVLRRNFADQELMISHASDSIDVRHLMLSPLPEKTGILKVRLAS